MVFLYGINRSIPVKIDIVPVDIQVFFARQRAFFQSSMLTHVFCSLIDRGGRYFAAQQHLLDVFNLPYRHTRKIHLNQHILHFETGFQGQCP